MGSSIVHEKKSDIIIKNNIEYIYANLEGNYKINALERLLLTANKSKYKKLIIDCIDMEKNNNRYYI
jgi:hypothetical protein